MLFVSFNYVVSPIITQLRDKAQNYQYHSNRPQHVIVLPDGSFPLPAIASPYQPAVILSSL
jgi:hypothetical protein